MRLFHTLQDLAAALPEIPRNGLILIPETVAVLIHPVPHGAFSALFSPKARFIVQAAGERARFAYRAWLSVPVFARIAQALPAAVGDRQWQAALSAYFVPPPEMPTAQTRHHPAPLTLPPLPDEAARLAWWAQCVRAYLDLWGGDRPFFSVSRADLADCERRIGCPLPPVLRAYHEHIGVQYPAWTIFPPELIGPLADACFWLDGIWAELPAAEADAIRARADGLLAFGESPDDGSLWCFHRNTGRIWRCGCGDGCLTQLPVDAGGWLDAVMILSAARAHGHEDGAAAALLRQRLGGAAADKLMGKAV